METELISGKRTNVIERGVVVLEDNEISLIVFFFFLFFSLPLKRHDTMLGSRYLRAADFPARQIVRRGMIGRVGFGIKVVVYGQGSRDKEKMLVSFSLSLSLYFSIFLFSSLSSIYPTHIYQERERETFYEFRLWPNACH